MKREVTKVGLISLGCAKNRVDSEEVLSYLARNGFILVSSPQEADLLIVNTCGFIEAAKKEAIDTIFDTLKYKKITVVIGCLVERYYEQLKKEIPEVDLFVPIRDYPRFGELLGQLLKRDDLQGRLEKDQRVYSTPSYQAYLQISDGCDNFCAFCAIPLIRGRFHSFDFGLIKKQIKEIAEKGVKEIVVISQDTSVYGKDLAGQNLTICSVLKEILQYPSFEFIRLLYLYPDEITDEFIQLYKDNPRLTPYFDVPIQHSEDHILQAMHRHGDKALLVSLFQKLRQVPGAVLRTTLIVGFPGESEEDVSHLKDFIEEVRFDHLGVFTYSPEEGTLAYTMKDQIPEKEKTKRYNLIMKAQAGVSFQLNQQRLGQIQKVLITGYDKKNMCYRGICDLYAPDDIDGQIYVFSSRPLEEGQVVQAKIVNAGIYDLDAQAL
jgi:ribosomal protein S12 methylthiotransferase